MNYTTIWGHCREGQLPPNCQSCDILGNMTAVVYGMNYNGQCQNCQHHDPLIFCLFLLCAIFLNAMLTYTLQLQSVRMIYLMTLKQLGLYSFGRYRPPFIMQGAYAKLFINYLNFQSLLLYSSPKYMYLGIGSVGGIQDIVWSQDCYLSKLSASSVTLMHLPMTVFLIMLLFLIQIIIGEVINRKSGIKLKTLSDNIQYQKHWYLLMAAPALTLVFLPYMMCDTYVVQKTQDVSQSHPSGDCKSNTYTGVRWGMAFVFLLIQWLVLPYRTMKALFAKRFELDRDILSIIDHGANFLEYRVDRVTIYQDEYYFWDCIKYFVKAICIAFLVTLNDFKLLSFLSCEMLLMCYIISLLIFKPYKFSNIYKQLRDVQLLFYEVLLMFATFISFGGQILIDQLSNETLNQAIVYVTFTIQLIITVILFIVVVSTFCVPSVQLNVVLSFFTGLEHRPSCIRIQVIKKQWNRVRQMIHLNMMMKRLGLQTSSDYNCTQTDLDDYRAHKLIELFHESQKYRKRLGIPIQRNINVLSPYQDRLSCIQYYNMPALQRQPSVSGSPTRSMNYRSDNSSPKILMKAGRSSTMGLSPFNKRLNQMPAYLHDDSQQPKMLNQEYDQAIVTFLFQKGTILQTNSLHVEFESKVRKLPISHMKNFLLRKALEKDVIDSNMEKYFADHADKPICIEYQIFIYNQEETPMEYVKIALDDKEEDELLYLNGNTVIINKDDPLKLTMCFRVNPEDINSHVFILGQYRQRGQFYQFQVMISTSLIKLAEIKQTEKSNEQYKNKLKFKLVSQCPRFVMRFDHLITFKENNPKIVGKNVPIGTYDMQLLWKYYFPLKYFDDGNNIFFYQMLIDSATNETNILVYMIREDEDKSQVKEEIDKQKRIKLLNDGILEIIKGYLMRY